MDRDNIAALQTDLSEYRAPTKESSLLLLADAVTVDPETSSRAVRDAVKAGWSHEQVARAVFFVSYFNMVTRIAASLALPPDELHQFSPNAELPMLHSEDD